MRTTVDIPDSLYRELKSKAAKQGCSVKELILLGVKTELHTAPRRRPHFVSSPLIRSKKPATLALDNEKIFELIPFP